MCRYIQLHIVQVNIGKSSAAQLSVNRITFLVNERGKTVNYPNKTKTIRLFIILFYYPYGCIYYL